RCLEKDRLRRYASAQNLAGDIARHLDHHPVSARPPSVPYRLQKLIRRNRRNLVVAGTALTVGLVAGIGLYLKERRAREDAFAAAQARYAVAAADRSTQAAAPMPADDREKVGALGEPEALDFSGNLSFPARSVRDGLAGASEYLLAAHPLAPLEEYVAVIRQCVVNGYRNHGFPQVGISTEVDRNKGRVRVNIDEGPRFVQGDVRVEGAGEVPTEEIVRSLTEPAPPMADPLAEAVETALAMQRAPQQQQKTAMMLQALNERIPSIRTRPGAAAGQPMIAMPGAPARDDITLWQRGQPVSFAKTFLGGIEATVRARLARKGHLLANVRAELEPEPAARCAHLVVRVQEGPRAVLGEIRVIGNQRNPSAAIIGCASLNPGMELTPEMLTRA
ncbi:MAG: hypothetical protein HYV75_02960, partial [Opitutae bacterium]|nr:hypothetical protein [Opitutae bacterium]